MKNQMLTIAFAIGFAALIANTAAVAQTRHTATIPFTFEAGGTEFPSGTYEIHRMGSLSAVQITNVENGKSKLISTPIQAGSPSATSPKLVFHASSDQYSLTEVWLAGTPGMKTYKSKGGDEAAAVKVAIK